MPSIIPEDLTQSGTHALVIGVSSYQHFRDGSDPTDQGEAFQMGQLSAAARSASEFAAWLLNDYERSNATLKSMRVLLSPSSAEDIHPDIANKLNGDYSATLSNVKEALTEFRNVCKTHEGNVAIVYVAGHGVQLTKHGAIVLLNDCGSDTHLNRLSGAIDMAGVHDGMNYSTTAQTQFWFVDACRQEPTIAAQFEQLKGALDLETRPGVVKTSPLFLSATTDTSAYARPGGLTLFFEALNWALDGNVASGPDNDLDYWRVEVTDLVKKLPDYVMSLAEDEDAEQSVEIAGKVNEAVFHEYPFTPQVKLEVDIVPDAAKGVSRGTLKENGRRTVLRDYTSWPLRRNIDAGLYLLEINTDNSFRDITDILNLKPPIVTREVDVS